MENMAGHPRSVSQRMYVYRLCSQRWKQIYQVTVQSLHFLIFAA